MRKVNKSVRLAAAPSPVLPDAPDGKPTYEILPASQTSGMRGGIVYQIAALAGKREQGCDTPGGFVSDGSVLSHEGSCWVGDSAVVSKSVVKDSALVWQNASVYNSEITGTARVGANSIVDDSQVGSGANITTRGVVRDCIVRGRIADYAFVYHAEVSSGGCIWDHSTVSSPSRSPRAIIDGHVLGNSRVYGPVNIPLAVRLNDCIVHGRVNFGSSYIAHSFWYNNCIFVAPPNRRLDVEVSSPAFTLTGIYNHYKAYRGHGWNYSVRDYQFKVSAVRAYPRTARGGVIPETVPCAWISCLVPATYDLSMFAPKFKKQGLQFMRNTFMPNSRLCGAPADVFLNASSLDPQLLEVIQTLKTMVDIDFHATQLNFDPQDAKTQSEIQNRRIRMGGQDIAG
jgi:carbonic anhydrase/acetyltransferase-like protein (isoleucine patch superfamily)